MAEALAEHGANVVVSSRKLDQCEATAAEINEHCGRKRPSPSPATLATKINSKRWLMRPAQDSGP